MIIVVHEFNAQTFQNIYSRNLCDDAHWFGPLA